VTALWPHQQAAIDQIAPLGRGMLGMDTGTGKSLTAIELLRIRGCRRTLIVCPLAMVRVWPRELRKHGIDWATLPLDAGTAEKRARDLLTADLCATVDGVPLVVTINYEATISKGISDALQRIGWDCLILDESHKAKAPTGKASTFLWQLSASIPHRLGLTATILHDRPEDAFAQYRIIDSTVFGTDYRTFCRRYCVTELDQLKADLDRHLQSAVRKIREAHQQGLLALTPQRNDLQAKYGRELVSAIGTGNWPPRDQREEHRILQAAGATYINWRLGKAPWMRHTTASYKNMDEFRARMEKITFVCRKRDVLDLPPVLHEERIVTLTAKTRKAYTAMHDELRAQVDGGEIHAANVLTRSVRLAQIVNGFCTRVQSARDENGNEYHDADGRVVEEHVTVEIGTEKQAALDDILSGLPADEPVAVFGTFHHDLDSIRAAAEAVGRTSCELSGRRNDLEAWQAGETNVIAVQCRSGGAGVDFTRSCYQVYLAHPWSLGDYEQSLGRIDRPGQTRPVTYIHIVAAETIDEAIMDALAAKRSIADVVMNGIGSPRQKGRQAA
jgi:SNF2 family DNA or RNA helicase